MRSKNSATNPPKTFLIIFNFLWFSLKNAVKLADADVFRASSPHCTIYCKME